MDKVGKWFLSDTGKTYGKIMSVAAGLSGFLAYMIPQGICIDQLQSIVQMYHEGLPKPLNPEIDKRAREVLERSGLHEKEKGHIKFFTSYGLDMFSAGCVQTNWGGIVGIPDTFNYKTRCDVNRASIKLRNTPEIKWGSDAGIKFQESLVLSENAQKFAIAREINMSSLPTVYVYGALAAFAVTLTTTTSRWANEKYNFYARPRSLRLTWYTLVGIFGFTAFLTLKDLFTVYFEYKADLSSAEMGEDYLEGGIEYFEKIMQRNKAVRILMGEYGESVYTAGGNDAYFIRTPHLPIDTRLDLLKKMKKSSLD